MSYSRVDLDAVAPLMPANLTAGRVVARGEHFEIDTNKSQLHRSEPIAWRLPTAEEIGRPNFVNLTAKAVGRLRVMGIAEEVKTRNGQNWVGRCVCGAYETRKARYIKACLAGENPGDDDPMCLWCDKTRRLRLGYGDPKKSAAAAIAIAAAVKNCSKIG